MGMLTTFFVLFLVGLSQGGASAPTSYLSQIGSSNINCSPNWSNDTFLLSEVPESMRFASLRDNGFTQPTNSLLGVANKSWSVQGVRMVLRTRRSDIVRAPLFVHPDVVAASVVGVRFVFAPVGSTASQETINATFNEDGIVTVYGNRTSPGQWTLTSITLIVRNASATIARSIAIGDAPSRLSLILLVDQTKQVPMYLRPDPRTYCYPLYHNASFRMKVGTYLPPIILWLMTASHQQHTTPSSADPLTITVSLNSSQGLSTLTTLNTSQLVVNQDGSVSISSIYFSQPLGAVQLLFSLDATSGTKVNTISFFVPFIINVQVTSYKPPGDLVVVGGGSERFFQCVSGVVGTTTVDVPVGTRLGGAVVDAAADGMFETYSHAIAVMQPIYVDTGLLVPNVDPQLTAVVDGLARFSSSSLPSTAFMVGDVVALQVYFSCNPSVVIWSAPIRISAPSLVYHYLSLWSLNQMLPIPNSTFVATTGITMPTINILVRASSGEVDMSVAAAQISVSCLTPSNSYVVPSRGGTANVVDGVASFSSLQFAVSASAPVQCRLVFQAQGFLSTQPLVTSFGYLYSELTKAVTISFARHCLMSPHLRQYESTTALSGVPMSDIILYVRNSDWSVDRTNEAQRVDARSSSAVLGSLAYALGGEIHFHSLAVPECAVACRLAFVATPNLGTTTLQPNTLLVTGEIRNELDGTNISYPRLSVNGTGLLIRSSDIIAIEIGKSVMFLVEFLDADLTVHANSITTVLRLDPKSSGAVLGPPQGNASQVSPTSQSLFTTSGSVLFGVVLTGGRGTADLSFCLDANVALVSNCVGVTLLVGTSLPLSPQYVVLSSLDGSVVNPAIENPFVVSVQSPSGAAIPTPIPTAGPVPTTATTTTTTSTTPTTTAPAIATTASSATAVASTTTAVSSTATSTMMANATTAFSATTTTATTNASNETSATTATGSTTETTTGVATVDRRMAVESAGGLTSDTNATGSYIRPSSSTSFSLPYTHRESPTGVETMYSIHPAGSASFDAVQLANPLSVAQSILVSPLVTDASGQEWNAAGFRQDDVDPIPSTTVVAYVNENTASFKAGTWLRKLADKVNVMVDRFEVVRITTAVVPALKFVGTRIEFNIRPPSVRSMGKKSVSNLINEVKEIREGCLATASTNTVSFQTVDGPQFCDVNELQERVESARHCENTLGREERCSCFVGVMATYGLLCVDAPLMGPTCEHLSRCTDSSISIACAGAEQNIAVQVVIVVGSTAGCILLIMLVIKCNSMRRDFGQRRARLKKGKSRIVAKMQHHDDVFDG